MEKLVKNEPDVLVYSVVYSFEMNLDRFAYGILNYVFKALNNGHRRASSPQSSSNSNQGTNPNLTRTNNATGATLRGRPPKTRKEVQNQSAVTCSERISKTKSNFRGLLFFRIFFIERGREFINANESVEY